MPTPMDLRAAFTSLRQSPGFTLIAVITLAIGIGANTAAFSMVNALLRRPLPYPEPDRLERIMRVTPQNSRGNVSPADYLDLLRDVEGYGAIAATGLADSSVAEPGRPAEMVPGLRVSTNLFAVLGAGPAIGRDFGDEDGVAGRHRVLLLSHRYWQKRFQGGDVLGKVMRVNGEPHEIVGVLPETLNDWRHLGPFDLFRPLALTDAEARDRATASLRIIGRRSAPEGDRRIEAFGDTVAARSPEVNAGSSWRTERFQDTLIPENAPGVLAMLIALSAVVLLIACSNLANLLLARTMGRAREFAVRASIGASRLRLLRPLFIESALLAAAGWIGALYVAKASNAWLNSFTTPGDPLIFEVSGPVFAWGAGAAIFTVLAFGVAPALFALRLDLVRALKSGSRGSTVSRGHQRFRQALVIGQFVFATVLLAAAALFARGVSDLNTREYGWKPECVISGSVLLPEVKYGSAARVAEFQRVALERLAALPGAASASVSYVMPLAGLCEPRKFIVEGQPRPEPGREPVAAINGVSAAYFETVGTPLVAGRSFTSHDTSESGRVVIINQAMARGLFGSENAIGKRIATAGAAQPQWAEIVGIAGDVRSSALERRAVPYQLYLPMAQEPRPLMQIAVRPDGVRPAILGDGIRATIAALDPDLALRQLQPAEVTIATVQRYPWLIGRLLMFLAVLGVGLALLGIYGVISRTVAQRTTEFGIRLALGATPGNIIRLVLSSGSRLAVIGAAIGLIGAFGVSRAIAAGWPGMQTNSGAVLGGITLLLLAVSLLACYLPARVASSVSPIAALRAD